MKLVTENGETSLEVALGNSLCRYLITNESNMFRVGDQIYKVFKTGIKSDDLSNRELLANMSNDDFESWKKSLNPSLNMNEKYSENISYARTAVEAGDSDWECGNYREAAPENGDYRIKFGIKTMTTSYYYEWMAYVEFWLKNQEKGAFGIWYNKERTTTAEFQALVDYHAGVVPPYWHREYVHNDLINARRKKWNGTVLVGYMCCNYTDEHFAARRMTARNTAVPEWTRECGEDLLPPSNI